MNVFDFFGNPWGTLFTLEKHWYDIALGSRENKAKAIIDVMGIPGGIYPKEYKTFKTTYINAIETQKKDLTKKEFWTKTVYLNTDIESPKMPSLNDIGKYALLIGLGIGGLYLLGKYIGGRK